VIVFGIGAEIAVRAKIRIGSKLARSQRAHGQPPAMAGSNRSSSASPSGVASPSR
jgi:hypothetical protein